MIQIKIKLGQLTYLNDSKNNDIAQLSEQVMSFEQLFFEDTKIMLSMANIFNIKLTIEDRQIQHCHQLILIKRNNTMKKVLFLVQLPPPIHSQQLLMKQYTKSHYGQQNIN